MDIKATDVKELRQKTGAGMMDCKRALVQAEGDSSKAERILKELGLAAAGKRSGRATNEGRVFSRVTDTQGILLELSCETDFVAKADDFTTLGEQLVDRILADGLRDRTEALEAYVQDAIGRIKENIALRRFKCIEAAAQDLLVEYVHGIGRIGVIVKARLSDAALKEQARVQEVIFDMALHTAAFAPLFLTRDQIGEDYLAEQEQVFRKQAEKLDKPEKVLAGIVKGKLSKHLSEICLLDQAFVKDESLKVKQVLQNLGKEVGGEVVIADFLYYKVGEGGTNGTG